MKKLCKLKNLDDKKEKKSFLKSVKKPEYYCSRCFRVSSNSGDLCKSEKLSDLKTKKSEQ